MRLEGETEIGGKHVSPEFSTRNVLWGGDHRRSGIALASLGSAAGRGEIGGERRQANQDRKLRRQRLVPCAGAAAGRDAAQI